MAKNKKKTKNKKKQSSQDFAGKFREYQATAEKLYKESRFSEAEPFLKKAFELRPKNFDVFSRYAIVLELQDKYDEALSLLLANPEAYENQAWINATAARICQQKDSLDDAISFAEKALKIDPENLAALSALGEIYKTKGDLDKAKNFYGKVHEIDPEFIQALGSLAEMKKAEKGSKDFEKLEKALKAPETKGELYAKICFSLGKMYNDVKEYGKAFHFYKRGNEMREKNYGEKFNIEKYIADNDYFMQTISRDFMETRKDWGLPAETPVFIVGMPRSGTTLTEQIIAKHPSAYGAGELPDIKRIFYTLLEKYLTRSDKISNLPVKLTKNDSVEAAEDYLETIIKISEGKALRVVDKMPTNYRVLWLIRLMFPKAKVIHCKRNPVDTCLSIYFQNFKTAHSYKNNLVILGRYYREYLRLMDHWKDNLPGPLFEIQYEELVERQEDISRKLINFCGLEWDDKCLEFYNSKAPVKTTSFAQVKQKIYKTSAGRWKNYEPHIGPLLEALEYER